MNTIYKDPTIQCCPDDMDEEEWITDLAFNECFLNDKIIRVQKLKDNTIQFLKDCNFTVYERIEDDDFHSTHQSYGSSSTSYLWHIGQESYYNTGFGTSSRYSINRLRYNLIKYEY